MDKDKLSNLAQRHGVKVALVGGALVVGTNYGSCTMAPPEEEVPALEDDAMPDLKGADAEGEE